MYVLKLFSILQIVYPQNGFLMVHPVYFISFDRHQPFLGIGLPLAYAHVVCVYAFFKWFMEPTVYRLLKTH